MPNHFHAIWQIHDGMEKEGFQGTGSDKLKNIVGQVTNNSIEKKQM
jgi:hypothetical protein